MLAANDGQDGEAIAFFDQAIQADANFIDARRGRAVLLARRGRYDEATRDINWCLDREPNSGANLYAAACVAALAYDSVDPQAASAVARQIVDFLHRAFRRGYGREQAGTDPDLAPVRHLPAVRALLQ
jgi:tetratricopeptide (TPR) repeat protein